MLHGAEQFESGVVVAERIEGQHQLARLGPGDPRPVVDAPDSEALHHEVGPPCADAASGLGSAHGATQNRVVPVHRVRRLGHEGVGMVPQHVAEPADGDFPIRLRVTDVRGQREGAAQAVVDAGVAGEQSVDVRPVRSGRPADLSPIGLQRQDEVDGTLHRGPQRQGEGVVARHEKVMPHPDRDVRAEVGVRARVLDDAGAGLQGPGSVLALRASTPFVRGVGLLGETGRRQRHRGLHVVPRVLVPGRRPGDDTRPKLYCRNGCGGVATLFGRHHPGDGRNVGGRPAHDAAPAPPASGLRR